jgi:carboxyl-terminal processing protease
MPLRSRAFTGAPTCPASSPKPRASQPLSTARFRSGCSSANSGQAVRGLVGAEILHLLREHFVDGDGLRRWIEAGAADALIADRAASETHTFDLTVAAALAALPVSHTQRFTPDQIEYFHLLDTYASLGLKPRLKLLFPGGLCYPGIGLLTRTHEGRYFIAALVPGGPAAVAGLARGDELLAVDERPFSPVDSFRGLQGRTAVLLCRRQSDRAPDPVPIRPVLLKPGPMLRRASRDSVRFLAGARRVIGYYRPWSLAGDAHWAMLVDSLCRRLKDCDALILDLRYAIGGASPDHAEFFVGRSPELRLSRPGHGEELVNPRWRKPVVVLADDTTRSGNEVLVFAMQRAGIPVVGQHTAGEVAAARPFLLSDGSLLLIATRRITVDDVVLEGRGVAPDIAVDAPLPYAGGADPQFEAAIALADRES